MKHLLVVTCFALATGIASAQLPSIPTTSMGVRGGLYFGGNFSGTTPGSSDRIEGLELGLDAGVFSLPSVEFRFSPTVAFGRSTDSGVDADFYRLIGEAKFNIPSQAWYVAIGTGYGWTDNHGSGFDSSSGAVGQLTFGIEPKGSDGTKLYYEVSLVFGKPELTGLSFDVGIKF
jgi:hypothetical protein